MMKANNWLVIALYTEVYEPNLNRVGLKPEPGHEIATKTKRQKHRQRGN